MSSSKTDDLILLAGGLGYIGSNVAVQLLLSGYRVLIVDNLANNGYDRLAEIKEVCQLENIQETNRLHFENVDLTQRDETIAIFQEFKPYAVICLAGLKAVGESVAQPLRYYDTNLTIVLNLLRGMEYIDCCRFIFSSSATVYNSNSTPPFVETSPIGITLSCPYAMTKYMIELMLEDLVKYNASLQVSVLRYFNPVGNHASGLLADNPAVPLNLLPIINNCLLYKRTLKVFGSNYDTPDGTPLRDYVHVEDIASAHTIVLEKQSGYSVYNIGLEQPMSVLEMIDLYETVNNIKIIYEIVERRHGDVPVLCSNSQKLRNLGWTPKWNIADCVKHCYEAFKKQRLLLDFKTQQSLLDFKKQRLLLDSL